MPTYVYACGPCKKRIETHRRIAQRDDCPPCPACGGATERQITATMVSVFSPYKAVAADKETGLRPFIKTRAEHEAFLRRNGYEEVGNDKSMAPPSREEFLAKRAAKLKEEAAAAAAVPPLDFNPDTQELSVEATP